MSLQRSRLGFAFNQSISSFRSFADMALIQTGYHVTAGSRVLPVCTSTVSRASCFDGYGCASMPSSIKPATGLISNASPTVSIRPDQLVESGAFFHAQPHYVLLDGNLFPDHESPPSLPCGDRDSEVAVVFNDGSD
jgi:hypothetical protein